MIKTMVKPQEISSKKLEISGDLEGDLVWNSLEKEGLLLLQKTLKTLPDSSILGFPFSMNLRKKANFVQESKKAKRHGRRLTF